ncbi:MAG: hypothetical protein MUO34_06750, partial [Ignavibacteriaceae bacterium]|nr:hypothetical protein [Ignavibacteriaceae bacterium]
APDDLFSSTVYDKGAWVLHMLRFEVGDSIFFNILRNYYNEFKYGSASINDFRSISETISQKDLTKFFDQWIFESDDQIKAEYSFIISEIDEKYSIEINIEQVQERYKEFHFQLELKIVFDDQTDQVIKSYIDLSNKKIKFESVKKPVDIIFDPHNWLLASFLKK